MRSILIIFATIVLVAIGFFAYLWFQSGSNGPAVQETAPAAVTPASRPTELPDPDRINGAGNGQNAWMRNIDEKTGLVSNEFRASKYEPRKDGTIDVTDPEAKFYLGSTEPRQMLVVRGKRGKVFVPDSGNTKNSNSTLGSKGGSTETPSHGNLKDVTLLLYDTPTSPEPNLVCTMDNASFDQETFRVYTDSFEHNGKMVAADEVPVQVRGVDYDFDGRGLDLRWNERDRRLQQLEIAHGERLVIKHPNALQQKQGGGGGNGAGNKGGNGGTANTPNPPTSFNSGFNLLPMLASADPTAAAMLIADANTAEPAAPRVHHTPAASEPAVAPVKIVRDKDSPIFRATFFDNVRIVQGDEQLATAKLMHIDFLMENSSTTKPSTAPSTEPSSAAQSTEASATTEPKSIAAAKKKSAAAQPASPQQQASAQTPPPTSAPTERHRRHGAAPTTASTTQPGQQSATLASTTAPATQPDVPVTIYWTGILRVTPLDAAMPDPPTKGDSIVTLLGDPVTLTHTGSRADAASVRYRTGNSSVLMESSETIPQVVLHDVNGSIIHTPSLQYDGLSNVAILRGVSQADLVTQAPSTQPATQPADAAAQNTPQNPPPMMHATWTRTCRLFMIGDPKAQMNIDRAEIDGDVTIDHPQIKGKSDSLELGFEQIPSTQPAAQPAAQQPGAAAPTTQPTMQSNLKTLLANGNVHYTMISQADGKTRTIVCSRLNLETARDDLGRTYARTINAQGGVHTYSDTQDLKCGTLALKLMPSTQPADADQQQQQDNGQMNSASTQVESMTADQDVRVSSVSGDTATCDRLTMDTKDGAREIVLVGEPMAHVKQKDDTLNGPIIRIDPDTNRAYVVGAGTMHAVQQSASGKPQPIDVSWTGNMDANGDLNVVNINDHVTIHSVSSDGSIDDATSDRLKMILMDDPRASTQPSTEPDTNSPMAQAGFGNTNFFKNKIVQTVYLYDNVHVTSVLNDAKGKLLRQMLLECEVLQYDVQTKTMIIPVPGKMLMQDLGKPPAGQSGEQPLGDMSGATAFEWSHEMRYVDAEHHMSMTGDVHVEHQGNGTSQPFTLHCQQLTADLEPVPTTQESDESATQPLTSEPATTQSASTKPSGEGKMRISHVTATDQVDFISHPMHFEASSIDYDPNTHEMIAKASDRVRAEMYDDKGEVASSFMELHYNTQTGQSESTDLRATIAKQAGP